MNLDIKYICSILFFSSNNSVNRTALNKLLFFADLTSFLRNNSFITKANYYRKPYGPVPEFINEAREHLMKLDVLSETIVQTGMYYEYLYSAQRINHENLIKKFAPEELSCLQDVKTSLGNYPASFLSEKSHEFQIWKDAYWDEKLDFKKAKTDKHLIAWMKEIRLLPKE